MRAPPPPSVPALLDRADALAGLTVGEAAALLGVALPADLRHAKGLIGQLVEAALGATAASHAEPDFPQLGVELKTVPIGAHGRPREATWVTHARHDPLQPRDWAASTVRERLSQVLFVPVWGEGLPATRRFGVPVFWAPTPDEEALLRADWEELTALLIRGEVWMQRGHRGRALQLRPKAAHRDDRVWVVDHEGEWSSTLPLGFYLRAPFVARLLAAEAGAPPG